MILPIAIGVGIAIMLFLCFKALVHIWRAEKDNILHFLKSAWLYIRDWRTFVSFLIAWMITNGWCYVFIILGSWLKIKWMRITGWSYLAFLWLPVTPEKVVTIPLGMGIKKILFRRKKNEIQKKTSNNRCDTLDR